MADQDQARAPSRPPAARAARALLGLVLLLGPLLSVELLMRQQIAWLRPAFNTYRVWTDMKLMFIEQRDRCPDAVVLGTSLSDHSLPPHHLAERELAGDEIDDPFDFAMAEARATTMLALYRRLRAEGCEPESIFVEVTPVVINGEHGGHTHDSALMSARAQLGMPDGFARLRDYDIADQLELATYDRLFIHRRRQQIVDRAIRQFAAERWLMTAEERDKAGHASKRRPKRRPKLEWHGKLTRIRKHGMSKAAWSKEERRRRGYYARGVYKWHDNDVEREALTTLVREAAADGVRVVVHAPPVSSLYRRLAGQLGMTADFELFTREVEALAGELPNVVWHNSFYDPSYERQDFFDWVHLSNGGGKRYVNQLFAASNTALRAEVH